MPPEEAPPAALREAVEVVDEPTFLCLTVDPEEVPDLVGAAARGDRDPTDVALAGAGC